MKKMILIASRVLIAGLLLWLYCGGLGILKHRFGHPNLIALSQSKPLNNYSFVASERLRFFLTNAASENVFWIFDDKEMKEGGIAPDYGRRGTTLNNGAKTNMQVSYDNPNRIFEKLVKEKMAKGYTPGEGGAPYKQDDQQPSGHLPRLLNPVEVPEVQRLINDDRYCAQEKFDGRRVLVSKEGEAINGVNKMGNLVGLPRSLFQVVHKLRGDIVFDGEAVGNVYYAFDLLVLNGEDIRSWTYQQRLTALTNFVTSQQQAFIKCSETAFTAQQKKTMLEQLRGQNKEGILFRRLDAPYTPGRPASVVHNLDKS